MKKYLIAAVVAILVFFAAPSYSYEEVKDKDGKIVEFRLTPADAKELVDTIGTLIRERNELAVEINEKYIPAVQMLMDELKKKQAPAKNLSCT